MELRYFLFIFSFIVSGMLHGCITDPNEEVRQQASTDEKFVTEIEWENPQKQLGTIEEGQKLEVIYQFTNKGSKPLVIKSATATCGCTVPEVPKEPILPGKSGMLKAVFDSEGRPGENHKSITVKANTNPGEHVLDFMVTVNPTPPDQRTQSQPQ